MFRDAFGFLQKIGKALMLPVAVLPVAGILLGVGSAGFSWMPDLLSAVMKEAGGVIFSNLPIFFAIGVAIGLGLAGLAAAAVPAVSLHQIPPWLPALPFACVALTLFFFGGLAWWWGRDR